MSWKVSRELFKDGVWQHESGSGENLTKFYSWPGVTYFKYLSLVSGVSFSPITAYLSIALSCSPRVESYSACCSSIILWGATSSRSLSRILKSLSLLSLIALLYHYLSTKKSNTLFWWLATFLTGTVHLVDFFICFALKNSGKVLRSDNITPHPVRVSSPQPSLTKHQSKARCSACFRVPSTKKNCCWVLCSGG